MDYRVIQTTFLPVLLLLLLSLLPACSPLPVSPAIDTINPQELMRGQVILGSTVVTPLPAVELLALNDEMRDFLRRYVEDSDNQYLKLHQLLYALINEGGFNLNYEEVTRTAQETFQHGAGNCLSFTNLFVAMAREVNLSVSYQQVDIPPAWEQQGGTFVLNRHINVLVRLAEHRQQVVDFNIDDFKVSYDRELVSDEQALVHYYNNIGVEKMLAGDRVQALLYFRKGLEMDEDFSPLWTNLGTLYSRSGYPNYAEASYMQALSFESRDYVAMTNLIRVHTRNGNDELAAFYTTRVELHRNRNPYYRYQLAREAFFAGNYVDAIKHLNYTIRLKEQEDSFYFLLGLSYLQTGDSIRARHYLEQAESLAADEGVKQRYASKIKLLLSDNP